MEGHPVRVWGLAFSPDSRLLATGGNQGVVKLWDMSNGEELYTLPNLVNTVTWVAFSPDGQHLYTNGNGIYIWDVETAQELLTLSPYEGEGDFSMDGSRLYEGGCCGDIIRVYAVPLEETIDLAKERVTRTLIEEECRQYLHLNSCPAE